MLREDAERMWDFEPLWSFRRTLISGIRFGTLAVAITVLVWAIRRPIPQATLPFTSISYSRLWGDALAVLVSVPLMLSLIRGWIEFNRRVKVRLTVWGIRKIDAECVTDLPLGGFIGGFIVGFVGSLGEPVLNKILWGSYFGLVFAFSMALVATVATLIRLRPRILGSVSRRLHRFGKSLLRWLIAEEMD